MTQTSCTIQTARQLNEQHSALSALKALYCQFQAIVNERRKRRRILTLLSCDDAILNDIGHTRAELEMALNLPYSVNAHEELKKWQKKRLITG